MKPKPCENCGLIDGHANYCYASITTPELHKLKVERDRYKIALEKIRDYIVAPSEYNGVIRLMKNVSKVALTDNPEK